MIKRNVFGLGIKCIDDHVLTNTPGNGSEVFKVAPVTFRNYSQFGLYFQKRNIYSAGISLTIKT